MLSSNIGVMIICRCNIVFFTMIIGWRIIFFLDLFDSNISPCIFIVSSIGNMLRIPIIIAMRIAIVCIISGLLVILLNANSQSGIVFETILLFH